MSTLSIAKSDFAHSNGNCHIHSLPSINDNTIIGTTGADGELSVYHVVGSSSSVIGHKRLHFSPIRDSHIISIPIQNANQLGKQLSCCISIGSDGQLRATQIITYLDSSSKELCSHIQSPKSIVNNICLLDSISSDGFVSSRLTDEFRMYVHVTKNSKNALLAFTDSTGMLWMHKLLLTPLSESEISEDGDNLQISSEPIPFTISSTSNPITSFLHLSENKFIILRQSGIVELFTDYCSTATYDLLFPTTPSTHVILNSNFNIIIRDSKGNSTLLNTSLKCLSTSKIPISYFLSFNNSSSFLTSTSTSLGLYSPDSDTSQSIQLSFQSPSDLSSFTKAPPSPNSYVFLPNNQIALILGGRLLLFSISSLKNVVLKPTPPPTILTPPSLTLPLSSSSMAPPPPPSKKSLKVKKSPISKKKRTIEHTDSSDDQMETDDGFDEFEDYDCSSMDGENCGDAPKSLESTPLESVHPKAVKCLPSPIIPQTTPHWSIDGTGGYRYLCWNDVASVTSRKDSSSYYSIEIDFHDRSFHRPIRFIDEFGYEMASINKDGVLFSTGHTTPSEHHHLHYLPFDSLIDGDPLHPKPLSLIFHTNILASFLFPTTFRYPIIIYEKSNLIRTFSLSGIEGKSFKGPSGHFISCSLGGESFSLTTIRNGNEVHNDIFTPSKDGFYSIKSLNPFDLSTHGGGGGGGSSDGDDLSGYCPTNTNGSITWSNLERDILTIIINHRIILQSSITNCTPFYVTRIPIEEDILPLKIDYSHKVPILTFLKGRIPEFIPKPSPLKVSLESVIGISHNSLSNSSIDTEEVKMVLSREKDILRKIETCLQEENYYKAKELSLLLTLRPLIEGAHKLYDHLNVPFLKEFLKEHNSQTLPLNTRRSSSSSSSSSSTNRLKERRDRIIGGMAGEFVMQEYHSSIYDDDDDRSTQHGTISISGHDIVTKISKHKQKEESQTLFDLMETIIDDDDDDDQ